MLDQLQMLHFHIGSQITEIRRIQKAVKEAARVYAKIKRKHININISILVAVSDLIMMAVRLHPMQALITPYRNMQTMWFIH